MTVLLDLDGFPTEQERLALTHQVFDPVTWQHLDRIGPLHGRRVLDAGAGRGQLTRALWGADRADRSD